MADRDDTTPTATDEHAPHGSPGEARLASPDAELAPAVAPPRPVAVVSGGSAGIGRAVAELLAERGHDVAVLARGEQRLKDTEAAIGARGVRGLGVVCDVSDLEQVRAARRLIVEKLGEPYVWVNSAMLTVLAPFVEIDDDEFRAVVDTTFMGQVNGTRVALEGMRAAGEGRIVNIGSGLSYRPVPLQSAYCAAKAAINGFTSAVRSELIHDGFDRLSIGLVQLPAVNTPQFDWSRHQGGRPPRPAAPVYQPEVAARAVWKAIRERSREVIVGRSVLGLVFGDMVAPGALDRQLASMGYDGQTRDPEADADLVRDRDNLFGPPPGRAGARGSFGDEAYEDGLIIDADRARAGVFGGGAIALLAAGVALGATLRRR